MRMGEMTVFEGNGVGRGIGIVSGGSHKDNKTPLGANQLLLSKGGTNGKMGEKCDGTCNKKQTY